MHTARTNTESLQKWLCKNPDLIPQTLLHSGEARVWKNNRDFLTETLFQDEAMSEGSNLDSYYFKTAQLRDLNKIIFVLTIIIIIVAIRI